MKHKTHKLDKYQQAHHEYFCIPKKKKHIIYDHQHRNCPKNSKLRQNSKQSLKKDKYSQRLSKNQGTERSDKLLSPYIEYQYYVGKRKADIRVQRDVQSYYNEQYGQDNLRQSAQGRKTFDYSIYPRQKFGQRSAGKIRRNIFKQNEGIGQIQKQINDRRRFYSLSNLSTRKNIKVQHSIQNGLQPDALRYRRSSHEYLHQILDKVDQQNNMYKHQWKSKNKKMGIQITQQDGHYEINLRCKKLKPKTNKQHCQINRKSQSMKTRDSPRKNGLQKCLCKACLKCNIDRERSKSVAVSTSTKDLQLWALMGNPETKFQNIEQSDKVEPNEMEQQYFFTEQPIFNRKFRNTVLTQEAIVQQVQFLRNLTLRLFSQRQLFIQKNLRVQPPIQKK